MAALPPGGTETALKDCGPTLGRPSPGRDSEARAWSPIVRVMDRPRVWRRYLQRARLVTERADMAASVGICPLPSISAHGSSLTGVGAAVGMGATHCELTISRVSPWT